MKKNFKENDELDIIVLIEKIKLMLLSLFLQIFRRSKSFLLGWKKLLVIIIAGLVLGYFQTDSKLPNAKEATVLVKINFDAGNYVYDAVDLINLKISSADYDFFNQEIKLNEDESVDEVSISPVIDIKDIMAKDINANEIRAFYLISIQKQSQDLSGIYKLILNMDEQLLKSKIDQIDLLFAKSIVR